MRHGGFTPIVDPEFDGFCAPEIILASDPFALDDPYSGLGALPVAGEYSDVRRLERARIYRARRRLLADWDAALAEEVVRERERTRRRRIQEDLETARTKFAVDPAEAEREAVATWAEAFRSIYRGGGNLDAAIWRLRGRVPAFVWPSVERAHALVRDELAAPPKAQED